MFKIYADGQLLYSSGYQQEGMVCSNPKVSLAAGKAGSVDFTMIHGHYLYGSIRKLKTRITVYMRDTLIFRGRVLNWTTDFYNQNTVHCEGDLTYLVDTLQPPRITKMTVSEYFGEIINEHNIQVESEKQFAKGIVGIAEAGNEIELDNSTYRDTRETLDSDLIGVYGGLLRTRTVGGTTYLDYINDYGITSSQTIEFGSNILDITENENTMNLYTVLLPTGDTLKEEEEELPEGEEPDPNAEPKPPPLPLTIESVNGGSKLLEKWDGVAKYGRIVHTEHFPGATTPETLLGVANDFFNKSYRDPGKTMNIRALDLNLVNTSLSQFLIGQYIHVYAPYHEIDVWSHCIAINYDLQNLENTELTIGPMEDLVRPGYSKAAASATGNKLSEKTGKAIDGPSGGKLGNAFKHITEGKDWAKIHADRITLLSGELDGNHALIELTKELILMEVVRHDEELGLLEGRITIEADKINAEVSRSTLEGETLSGRLTITDSKVEAEVARSTAEGEALAGLITVTATSIDLEVSRAKGKENELSSAITINEQQINLRVKTGEIITSINVEPGVVTINAAKVNINGVVSATEARIDSLMGGYVTAGYILMSKSKIGDLTATLATISTANVGYLESSGGIVGNSLSINGTNVMTAIDSKITPAAVDTKITSALVTYTTLAVSTAQMNIRVAAEDALSTRITTAQSRADEAYTLAGQSPTGALSNITTITASGKIVTSGDMSAGGNIGGNQIWGTTLKSSGGIALGGAITGATNISASGWIEMGQLWVGTTQYTSKTQRVLADITFDIQKRTVDVGGEQYGASVVKDVVISTTWKNITYLGS